MLAATTISNLASDAINSDATTNAAGQQATLYLVLLFAGLVIAAAIVALGLVLRSVFAYLKENRAVASEHMTTLRGMQTACHNQSNRHIEMCVSTVTSNEAAIERNTNVIDQNTNVLGQVIQKLETT